MREDHIKIEVVIAGRSYPLKIKPSEEQQIKQLVSETDQVISDLKKQFPLKDGQDHLAMALLTLGNKYFQLPEDSLNEDIEEKLRLIEGYLDEMSDEHP